VKSQLITGFDVFAIPLILLNHSVHERSALLLSGHVDHSLLQLDAISELPYSFSNLSKNLSPQAVLGLFGTLFG
jgi:hypothetical protein